MNIEFIDWLAKNDVEFDRMFGGGYSLMGISFNKLRTLKPQDLKYLPSRENAIRKFSFAIPSEEALTALIGMGPILEVGAGLGYWAYELRRRGGDVVAIDPKAYSDTTFKGDVLTPWTEILCMDANRAIMEFGADRSMFFCWPSYTDEWTGHALKQFAGKKVAYIGEGRGGCTANDEFHEELENNFEQTAFIKIPKWSGINDVLTIHERK